jgi:hypothetical protein
MVVIFFHALPKIGLAEFVPTQKQVESKLDKNSNLIVIFIYWYGLKTQGG